MKRIEIIKTLATGLFCLGLAQQLTAATIYDNSVNDQVIRFHPGTAQVGDEITLAGTERYLTRFDFEYFGTNSASPGNLAFAGNVKADVKIYLNDGPLFNGYATPGTVVWDSGLFGGFGPTPRSTLIFTVAGGDFPSTGLFLPANNLTWAVQFSGMAGTDDIGLDIYSPPVVGGTFPDYWQNSGSGWQLLTNNAGIPMNFGARMFASAQPVPEPSMEAFAIVGAIFSLGAARWKIRSSK